MNFKSNILFCLIFLMLNACQNNKLKRVEKHFRDNTGIKEVYYLDKTGKKQKNAYEYYENGKIKEVKNFRNNKLDGYYRIYHENGRLKTKAKYSNDVVIDTSFYYYENGNLQAYSIYDKHGAIVKEVMFYPSGELEQKRAFLIGTGQIHATIAYLKNGSLDDEACDFLELREIGNKKNADSLYIKMHGLNYRDSISIFLVKNFDYDYELDADIVRTIQFTNVNEMSFRIQKSDYVRDKLNILIVTQNVTNGRRDGMSGYIVRLNKGAEIPKNNVEGIYPNY